MNVNDLRPNMLVADGRTLLKVSNIYRGPSNEAHPLKKDDEARPITRVTAQVLLPVPPRTTVQSFSPDHVEAMWSEPYDRLVHKYEVAYGLPATTP